MEYALVMSVFLVTALGIIGTLTDNGEELLNDSGTGIAEHRPFDEDIDDTTVATAPAGLVPPAPSSLLTFVEREVAFSNGSCLLDHPGLGIVTGSCTSSHVASVSGLSEDGTHISFGLGDGSQCLTVSTAGAQPSIEPGPCGGDDLLFTQESLNGLDVTYKHVDTGLCLTTVGADLGLAPCNGSPEQTITVIY